MLNFVEYLSQYLWIQLVIAFLSFVCRLSFYFWKITTINLVQHLLSYHPSCYAFFLLLFGNRTEKDLSLVQRDTLLLGI
jgi:hypothetical protein